MIRRFASPWMLVALAPLTIAACSKDKKDGEDAAAEAAVAVVDAAPEAAAPVVSASVAPLAPPPVVVKPKPPAAPDPPICVAARSARARNSPAAPNLEAQCKAAGGKL